MGAWRISGPTSIKAFREDGTKRVEGGPNFNLCGLGVNPVNGFLWAGSGQTATRLDPNTAFGGETYFYEQGPCHFTIDPAGNFYVNRISGTYTPGLFKYADESQFLKESFNPAKLILQFTKLNTKYTAFDTGDNTLFAVEGNPGNQVTQYSDAGQPIQTFGLAEGPFTGLAGARAVAVNPATQDVYVTSTDGSPRVDIFHRSETVTVPDATTNPAGHPNGTSAVLKGTINPDGVKTTQCKFEWGQSSFPGEYSNGTIPCSEGNEFEGSTNQSVTAEVSSLTLGSSFHYRVAVKNANGRFTSEPTGCSRRRRRRQRGTSSSTKSTPTAPASTRKSRRTEAPPTTTSRWARKTAPPTNAPTFRSRTPRCPQD